MPLKKPDLRLGGFDLCLSIPNARSDNEPRYSPTQREHKNEHFRISQQENLVLDGQIPKDANDIHG